MPVGIIFALTPPSTGLTEKALPLHMVFTSAADLGVGLTVIAMVVDVGGQPPVEVRIV